MSENTFNILMSVCAIAGVILLIAFIGTIIRDYERDVRMCGSARTLGHVVDGDTQFTVCAGDPEPVVKKTAK